MVLSSEWVDISEIEQLKDWVQRELASLPSPALFLLYGNLGAGKTQLVRSFCELQGFKEVQSPTFAIHNQYKWEGFDSYVEHVDLYRLETEDDVESSGFWDLFASPEGYFFVEWAERISENCIPSHLPVYKIQLEKEDNESSRRLKMVQLY